MSNVKIDINASDWQSRQQADEQIATLRLCIVSFREAGLDMDFSAVERAKKSGTSFSQGGKGVRNEEQAKGLAMLHLPLQVAVENNVESPVYQQLHKLRCIHV